MYRRTEQVMMMMMMVTQNSLFSQNSFIKAITIWRHFFVKNYDYLSSIWELRHTQKQWITVCLYQEATLVFDSWCNTDPTIENEWMNSSSNM